jgi:hypothetical protein
VILPFLYQPALCFAIFRSLCKKNICRYSSEVDFRDRIASLRASVDNEQPLVRRIGIAASSSVSESFRSSEGQRFKAISSAAHRLFFSASSRVSAILITRGCFLLRSNCLWRKKKLSKGHFGNFYRHIILRRLEGREVLP